MAGKKKRTVYVYRCVDCGHEDGFLYELQENTAQRCSLCRGWFVYVRTEER